MEIYIWGVSRVSKTIVQWVNQSDFPPQLKTSTLCMPWWIAQIAYTFNIYLATQNKRFVKKNYGINWIIDVNQEDANVTLEAFVILATSFVIRGPINCSMVECNVWMYNTSPILLLNVTKVAKLWKWKFIFGNCALKLSERNSSKPYSNGLKWGHHFDKENIRLLHATFENFRIFTIPTSFEEMVAKKPYVEKLMITNNACKCNFKHASKFLFWRVTTNATFNNHVVNLNCFVFLDHKNEIIHQVMLKSLIQLIGDELQMSFERGKNLGLLLEVPWKLKFSCHNPQTTRPSTLKN
jgi:hypothetical protein